MTTRQSQNVIGPRDLPSRLAGGGELLDVRTPAEFAELHVPGATLVPLDQLDAAEFLKRRSGGPIYLLCQSGARARRALEKFRQCGFHDCVLIDGGIQAWIDAGLPVVHGERRGLPIMRQVQIVAGLIVATGAALALAIDFHFAIIPLIIGSGLTFAGLTGFCGMALLLMKMPWNRASASSCGACCQTEKSEAS